MADEVKAQSNIASLKKAIKEGVDKIEQFKLDRTSLNEEIAAVRADLEAKGVKKKSLDMAMAYMNMDETGREGFDISYAIVREALGEPLKTDQMDMHELMGEGVKA